MRVCPRCGARGTPYEQKVSNRRYLYFVHTEGGKKRRCYIGPAEGYALVARLYDMDMQHAFDARHKLLVLEELLEHFSSLCRKGEKGICEEAKRAAEEFLKSFP